MGAARAGVDVDEKVDVLIVTAVEIEYQQALLVETGAWSGSVWERHPDRTAQCADYKKVVKQPWEAELLDDGALTLTEAGRKHIGRRRILDPDGFVPFY